MSQRKNNIYYLDYGSKYGLTNMLVKFTEYLNVKNTEGYLFFRNNELATYVENIITQNLKDCNEAMTILSKSINKSDYKFFNIPYVLLNYEEEYNTIVLDDTLIKFNFVDSIVILGSVSDITYEKAKRFNDSIVNVFFNEHDKYNLISAHNNNSMFRAIDVDKIEASLTNTNDDELNHIKSLLSAKFSSYTINREWNSTNYIYNVAACIQESTFKYYQLYKLSFKNMCEKINSIDIEAIKQSTDYQQRYDKYLKIKQLL